MSRDGLPGAIRRSRRNRGAWLAASTLAAVAVLVSLVGQVAAVRLVGAVDGNWRGAYDLLVRPAGARLDVERTNGLIEPNFLSFDGLGGIGLDDLAALRQVDGVELAAPIGLVGYMRYVVPGSTVFTSVLPDKPTLYRISSTFTSNDGLRDVLVASSSTKVLLGPWDLSKPNAPFATDGRGFDYSVEGVSIPGPQLPTIVSPLIAVDPLAERQLLGPTAAFLDALARVPTSAAVDVGAFDLENIPASFDSSRFFLQILKNSGDPITATRPVIPLIVSSKLYAPLVGRLDVEQLGESLGAFPPEGPGGERMVTAERDAGPGMRPIGSSVLDGSTALRPFQAPSLSLLWPGSTPPSGTEIATSVDTSFTAETATRPSYRATSGSTGLSFEIAPLGPVTSDGRAADRSPGTGIGRTFLGTEQSYRSLVSQPIAIGRDFSPATPFDRPFVFAPIGEFDLGTLDRPSNPNAYVPFGAYDPPNVFLEKGPDGTTLASPAPMTATLNPIGLVQVPPLAISDLGGLVTLRGDRSIDAVRVRVEGLTGYDRASIAKVERVASEIAGLGMVVDIVAGSSPQDVAVSVPAYRVEGDNAFPLGTVRQPWTTLGAAQRVESSLGSTNWTLVGLALMTAVVFAVGIEAMTVTTRRRDIAMFMALGWTRPRLLRWYAAESLVPPLLLTVVIVGAWLGSGGAPVGLIAGLVVIAAIPAAAIVGTWLGSRAPGAAVEQGDSKDWWLASAFDVRGIGRFAWRSVVSRPVRSLATIAAVALGAIAVGVQIEVLGSALANAGPTHLAASLALELRPYQVGLIVVCGAANIGLALALLRIDALARRAEFRVLAALGWPRGAVRRLLVRERLAVGLTAALLAALGGGIVGSLMNNNGTVVMLIAAVVAALLPLLTARGALAE